MNISSTSVQPDSLAVPDSLFLLDKYGSFSGEESHDEETNEMRRNMRNEDIEGQKAGKLEIAQSTMRLLFGSQERPTVRSDSKVDEKLEEMNGLEEKSEMVIEQTDALASRTEEKLP